MAQGASACKAKSTLTRALRVRQVAIRRAQGQLEFADMHVPDSAPRAWLGWLRELWQGARRGAARSALPQAAP